MEVLIAVSQKVLKKFVSKRMLDLKLFLSLKQYNKETQAVFSDAFTFLLENEKKMMKLISPEELRHSS